MRLADVTSSVGHIRRMAGDPDVAHGEEDALHRAVLRAIARGDLHGGDAADFAREALSTVAIEFPRWTA